MKKTFWLGLAAIVLVVIIFYLTSTRASPYDDFARCLTEKGAKMYGAYWCPHCQSQKKLFERSWDLVNYIECSNPGSSQPNEVCISAGIKGYPTWVFSDGNSISGELSLQQLSSFTSCELPDVE